MHRQSITEQTETEKRMCHLQFILFKMVPLFSVPLSEPQSFNISGESSNSVNLSWEAIPIGKRRGFLSHYSLCSLKINSEQKDEGPTFHFHHDFVAIGERPHKSPKSNLCGCDILMVVFFFSVCYKVSAFVTEHRLVNLTPGSKYSISLAAATAKGEGPQVVRIINTPPENMTGKNLKCVWSVSVNTQDLNTSPLFLHLKYPPPSHLALLWVLSVLFVMILISTFCTCMFRQ